MKNYYRTISNFVLGLCVITKEKYEPFIKNIQDRGDEKYKEKNVKMNDEFSTKVESICNEKLSKMNLIGKDDFNSLQERVSNLEKSHK